MYISTKIYKGSREVNNFWWFLCRKRNIIDLGFKLSIISYLLVFLTSRCRGVTSATSIWWSVTSATSIWWSMTSWWSVTSAPSSATFIIIILHFLNKIWTIVRFPLFRCCWQRFFFGEKIFVYQKALIRT